MNTTRLKKFATEARNKLRQGVLNKLVTLGFDAKGQVAESPVEVAGGAMWKDKPCTILFYRSFKELESRIAKHGLASVVEEAAYTWFNRFMAIRIMAMNQLCDPVLRFVGSARTPMIVDEARQGHYPEMDTESLRQLQILLDDDTKTTEQFAILIIAFCHNTPIIEACFGEANSFTELLIPSNILAEDGFIDMINKDFGIENLEFRQDDDSLNSKFQNPYSDPELLGWLYQFYISERKDEVFAKKGKYNADDIPAATQIFTPNWIVKYMVQNAVVPQVFSFQHSAFSELKEKYRYLVEPPESENCELETENLREVEDLRLGDLGCGSGHILGEMFDLLYEIYIGDGYSRREAVECIFRKNVVGIDIDNRACQLARFALLLRACQKDNSLVDASILPRVIEAPYPFREVYPHDLRGYLPHFFLGTPSESLFDELTECFKLIDDAKELGSIIKFNLGEQNRKILADQVAKWESQDEIPQGIKIALPYMDFILALTDKYDALVMNPPYMGSGNMSTVLSNYVKTNYPVSKEDLATVFVEMAPQHLVNKGKYAFIIPPSWMFLSGFEALRRVIIDTKTINSLLHLSRGVFGADFGSSSAVITNERNQNASGIYFRLIERTFQEFDQKHLCQLFERTLENHDFRYKFIDYSKDVEEIEYSDDGAIIYYPNILQSNFEKIPGSPLGYWLSEKLIDIFNGNKLEARYTFKKGMSTGDNNRFIKYWFEPSFNNIHFDCENKEDAISSGKRWFPINCGGTFRKWYGNQSSVVNWFNDGEEMKENATILNNGGHWSRYITSTDKFFKNGLSWNAISSGDICVRYFGNGFLFASASMCGYGEDLELPIGLLNSIIGKQLLPILAPTMNYGPMQIKQIPLLCTEDKGINILVDNCISISQADWDAHETSWDFKGNEIVWMTMKDACTIIEEPYLQQSMMVSYPRPEIESLEFRTELFKKKWERLFLQLHSNEEELNRKFIEIYGLQDELSPHVDYEDITILQQGEISLYRPTHGLDYYESKEEAEQYGTVLEDEEIVIAHQSNITWNDSVLMKQLLSYAIGCMMGRYRLDRPGLAIAHPNEKPAEVAVYSFQPTVCSKNPDGTENCELKTENFWIDDDGIIPLMPEDCGFHDNAANRLATFIRQVFGAETQAQNLNYIESCLGKTIEQYFIKDFWKDHKKMYQNRPIYWLFASKKGSFQVLVYVHRMNVATVERIRSRYLLPYIERLNKRIEDLEAREALLSTKERKLLQDLRKQVEECTEYHNRLAVVAERGIVPDLDAGIIANHDLYGDVVAKLK